MRKMICTTRIPLLCFICSKKQISYTLLGTYALDCEQLFKDMETFGTRDKIKSLFIVALFQGDYLYHNESTPIPFLTNFQQELKSNARAFLSSPPFSHFVTLASSNKSNRPLRTALSYVCQIEESKIQRAKVQFTEFCQRKVAADLYDGRLREHGDLNLEACSAYVRSETGYSVIFTTPQPTTQASVPSKLPPLKSSTNI